jgi:anaerobic selenocysteine-containing dehydrogenase
MDSGNPRIGSADPEGPVSSGRSRRDFLRRAAAGAVIAIPALKLLLGASPAAAETGHCSPNVRYNNYLGHECTGNRWIGTYDCRCGLCGGHCYYWTDDEGPCCSGLVPC